MFFSTFSLKFTAGLSDGFGTDTVLVTYWSSENTTGLFTPLSLLDGRRLGLGLWTLKSYCPAGSQKLLDALERSMVLTFERPVSAPKPLVLGEVSPFQCPKG